MRQRGLLVWCVAATLLGSALSSWAAVDGAATTAPATQAATRPAQTPVLGKNTKLFANVPYVVDGQGVAKDPKEVLDIYAPERVEKAPVLIFVHGGEWSRGDKEAVSSKPQFLNEHGVVFVSVNYRLSPKDPHPAQVSDVATSIAWVKANIAKYGGDPNKVVIMGHSAGCHLVTLTALDPKYLAGVGLKPSDLCGVVAWSGGMYDLVARAKGTGMYPPFIKATFGEAEQGQHDASPLTHAENAKGGPRFLIASVDDDKSQSSREASKLLLDAINKAGGKAEAALLVGKSHFTANHELGAEGDKTGAILLDFIQQVTK